MARRKAQQGTPRGTIKKVRFKDAFASEAEFTAWLATEKGLALLKAALDVELEAVATEHPIGGFRADLICRRLNDGALVIVENQISRSNHKHLGQVLTYSAGVDAKLIVWIAEDFTDQHRAVIDWHNEVTNEDIRVFALEIEIWKIGDSDPAPKLNVVSQPNDWRKLVQIQADVPEEPATGLDRVAFWTRVDEKIKAEDAIGKPPPSNHAHAYFGSRRSNQFRLRGSFSTQKNHLQVALEVRKENGYAHAKLLEDNRAEIEAVVGETLNWKYGKKGEASVISLEKLNVSLEDGKNWGGHADWLVNYLKAFHEAFWDRVQELNASEWIDPDDDDADIDADDDEDPRDDDGEA